MWHQWPMTSWNPVDNWQFDKKFTLLLSIVRLLNMSRYFFLLERQIKLFAANPRIVLEPYSSCHFSKLIWWTNFFTCNNLVFIFVCFVLAFADLVCFVFCIWLEKRDGPRADEPFFHEPVSIIGPRGAFSCQLTFSPIYTLSFIIIRIIKYKN